MAVSVLLVGEYALLYITDTGPSVQRQIDETHSSASLGMLDDLLVSGVNKMQLFYSPSDLL